MVVGQRMKTDENIIVYITFHLSIFHYVWLKAQRNSLFLQRSLYAYFHEHVLLKKIFLM